MADEEHCRKLERMYMRARCNSAYSDLSMEVGNGSATVRMTVDLTSHHPGNQVHGAHYFKMLDDAAFFAASSVIEDLFVLTASMNVSFLRPVAEGRLTAEGEVVRTGANLIFAESILYDRQKRELARATGTFAKSRLTLAELPEYE